MQSWQLTERPLKGFIKIHDPSQGRSQTDWRYWSNKTKSEHLCELCRMPAISASWPAISHPDHPHHLLQNSPAPPGLTIRSIVQLQGESCEKGQGERCMSHSRAKMATGAMELQNAMDKAMQHFQCCASMMAGLESPRMAWREFLPYIYGRCLGNPSETLPSLGPAWNASQDGQPQWEKASHLSPQLPPAAERGSWPQSAHELLDVAPHQGPAPKGP